VTQPSIATTDAGNRALVRVGPISAEDVKVLIAIGEVAGPCRLTGVVQSRTQDFGENAARPGEVRSA